MYKRTEEIENKYLKYLLNNPNIAVSFLEEQSIKEWKHWKIIKNKFPYDVKTHHLLIPKNISSNFNNISLLEEKEYHIIKEEISSEYDTFIINTSRARTVPTWWHEHLIEW